MVFATNVARPASRIIQFEEFQINSRLGALSVVGRAETLVRRMSFFTFAIQLISERPLFANTPLLLFWLPLDTNEGASTFTSAH